MIRNSQRPAMSTEHHVGLTKREYFAAMAMQGLLASDAKVDAGELTRAWIAVQHADALLTELAKERPNETD